jgi:zinc D-Ala-D-Ala dipeptidase
MVGLLDTYEHLAQNPDFTRLDTIPNVRIELRYGTTNNFMSKAVYENFNTAFLHRLAAEKLRRASELLAKEKPGFSFLVFDALRPRCIQRVLWSYVEGTENERYVANPDRGGMHNYGCAIDLSLTDSKGRELDMGTGFDAFVPLSQPKLEAQYLASGELTAAQHENRLLLRRVMTGGGFHQLPHEWWHYDAFPQAEVRERFAIIE